MVQKITAIIVAKNEEDVIEDTLKSITWCDQIVHVDNGSTDQTINLVKKYGGKTITTDLENFDQRKNLALKHVTTSWLIYVDADERVTPLLRQEIHTLIKSSSRSLASAYEIPRRNIYLGKEMRFGGWGNETVIRLFQTEKLKSWQGILHEQPQVEGEIGKLNHEIVHLSHRDLESMVEKTIVFTEKEAQLRLQASHPPITWWRLFRVMLTEFWLRFVKLSAWRDGTEGVVDGLFQIFNSFIIYARLWEMQVQRRVNPTQT